MLYRTNLKVQQLNSDPYKSFEFKELLLHSDNCITLTIIVNRPPISVKNGRMHDGFFYQFSMLLEHLVSSPGNLVLDGDFNFHVNDPSGSTASQFLDLLNCFNLDIVNLCPPTHENSNVLDLIITKSGETSISNLITLQFTAAWPTILALSIQLKVTAKPCFVQLLVFFTVKKINFSLALLQLTSLINSFTSLRRKSSISEVILVHL